jgi:hypothetical protein
MAKVTASQIQAGPQNTPDPQLIVTADPAAGGLPPGKYTFSLVVTDDLNQTSATATLPVEVRAAPAVKISGPSVVAFNQDITLNAVVNTTGTIKNYSWSVK